MDALTAKGVTPASNSPTDIATAIGKIEDAYVEGEWIPYYMETVSYGQNYYKSPAIKPYINGASVVLDFNGYWFSGNSNGNPVCTNNEDGSRYIPTKGFKYMEFLIMLNQYNTTTYKITSKNGTVIVNSTIPSTGKSDVSSNRKTISDINVSNHEFIMLEVNIVGSGNRGFGTIRFYN